MKIKSTSPNTKKNIENLSTTDANSRDQVIEQKINVDGKKAKGWRGRNVSRPKRVAVDHLSYEEACELVQKYEINTIASYREFRKEHNRLPIEPASHYDKQWAGWDIFFGRVIFYETLEECQVAARALGLKGAADYKARRHLDPRLHSAPNKIYPNFPGFEALLGFADIPYETYAEASAASIRLGIKTKDAYHKDRRRDAKLPRSPNTQYAADWEDWSSFLNNLQPCFKKANLENKYKTYEEFKDAVEKLGIKTQKEYWARIKEDPMLPASPNRSYKEWEGWGLAMAGRKRFMCRTWQEAREVCLQYRFTSATEYVKKYSVDMRLPNNPQVQYEDFPGWPDFLLPNDYDCLEDIKFACKILKVKNEQQYRDFCAKYKKLPPNPEQVFEDEWQNWYDTCGLLAPYTFTELQEILQLHNCNKFDDYLPLRQKLNDPRMPRNPRKVYSEWKNTHDFVKKDPPARFKYVSTQSKLWVEDMQKYLRKLDAKGAREYTFCKFLRYFVEPNNYGSSVKEFLTSQHIDIKKCRDYIESQGDGTAVRRTWYELNNYLNDALVRHFTVEDEETGEVVRISGAANPLAAIPVAGGGIRPSESVKPALAYQYVQDVRYWVIPEDARTFKDLKNIHRFDSDYHPVDKELIDFNDPNCVYRVSGGKYFLWFPANWVALYALVSVPSRGRQIMYNDSGEADEFIVEYVDGKPQWIKNTSPMSQKDKQEGFVTHSGVGEWGMHNTSNKTALDGAGYNVPWIPEQLIYWLTVLRDWQTKYNPITRPKPWVECTRTNLTLKKLKRKGANCFLFRAFREEEPPVFTPLLTPRLAAALYHIQPRGLNLASCDKPDDQSILSRYSSQFTPHSMRVSLVTAFIVDFGMPVEIVMKIVGHSSIVMNIYYVKINSTKMRHLLAEGEKRALLNQAAEVQIMVEQNRLDKLAGSLVANSEEALAALMSGLTGTQLVRDYGICPYAGARCEDGGAKLYSGTYASVPAGYLGMQNCPRCRHLVSGPVFLGGLASLWNEISLRVNLYTENHSELDRKLLDLQDKVQKFDYLEAEMEELGTYFDDRERLKLEAEIRQLRSNMESAGKKIDMFLCDMQAVTRIINESKVILEKTEAIDSDGESLSGLTLLEHAQSELKIEFEETSLYHQLNEVCTNATIYNSASAEFATPRRSQMIDRMAMLNDIRPVMCNLSERQQLILGNQVTEFFFSRLKSWEKVDAIIKGDLLLQDLDGNTKITKREFASILSSSALSLPDEIVSEENSNLIVVHQY